MLAEEQLEALSKRGVVWEPHDLAFNEGIIELETYVRKHGNAAVPQVYRTSSGFALGIWLSARRAEKRSGALAAERILSGAFTLLRPAGAPSSWRS